LAGAFVEVVFTTRGAEISQQKIVHFLTDSKSSYLGIATLILRKVPGVSEAG
jgi:hypothetical protein